MRFKFIAQRLRAEAGQGSVRHGPVAERAARAEEFRQVEIRRQADLAEIGVVITRLQSGHIGLAAQPVRRLPGASGARQLTPFGCLAAFWLPSFFGAQLRKALPCS